MRQEDYCKCKANLGYILSSRPAVSRFYLKT